MGIFSFFSNLFSGSDDAAGGSIHSPDLTNHGIDDLGVNPANGLPMMDSVFDVQGNTFGTDNHSIDHGSFNSGFDSFGGGGGSMFD